MTRYSTVPFPAALLPDVTMIQEGALLVAFHLQLPVAMTATFAVPPSDVKELSAAERV
jgi:hypothetical protein